jgi:hypothetical protein
MLTRYVKRTERQVIDGTIKRRPPRQAGRERSFRPFRRSKKNDDPPSGAAPGGEPTFSFLSERQQPFVGKRGDPGRTRTCDLQLRRLLLYPLSYGAEAGLFVQLCLAAMRKARSPSQSMRLPGTCQWPPRYSSKIKVPNDSGTNSEWLKGLESARQGPTMLDL